MLPMENADQTLAETLPVQDEAERRRFDWWRLAGIAPVLLIMVIAFALTSPVFLTVSNLSNIFRESASVYIMAVGMTMLLLIAGFDLSIGSLLALAGVMLYIVLAAGVPSILAVVLVIAGCAAFGYLVHGVLISKAGLSFFVVTLGTMSALRGAVFVITNGKTQYTDAYPLIQWIGDGKIGSFPFPVALAIIIYILGFVVLNYTRFGRSVYAVGGNPEASALAGVRVARVQMTVYAVCAATAGLAGIMTTGRLSAASPYVGTDTALAVAAAVLLGGTSFAGGEGGLLGTLVGTTFVVVLQNGLSLLGVSAFWQSIVTGLVLILAVGVDRLRKFGRG